MVAGGATSGIERSSVGALLDRDEMLEHLRVLAVEHTGVEEIEPDMLLATGLGLDSLGLVELLAAVEDAFDVEFEREEVRDFERLRDVMQAIVTKRR